MPRSLWILVATLVLAPLQAPLAQTVIPNVSGARTIATYRVTFRSTWSAATHPQDFPGNPHFSGLIGATHGTGISFWEVDGLASDGIESMAETGSKSQLTTEVNDAIAAGRAEFVVSGGGIAQSPGEVVIEFDVSDGHPLVTLVSMLAPSPDWFVGVAGLNLREGGDWVQRVEVPLVVYDAGTDSGESYTSANDDTEPPEVIAELTGSPFDAERQVGTFVFERVDVVGVEGEGLPGAFGQISVYPKPTSGPVFIEFDGVPGVEHTVKVYDVLGRVVDSAVRYGSGPADFDFSDRPPGLYVVSVSDGRATLTVPVVVSR